MRKIIAICNTPYQLIILLQLKYKLFQEELVDILLTDRMKDYVNLKEELGKLGIFNYVGVLYIEKNIDNVGISKIKKYFQIMYSKKYIEDDYFYKQTYTDILFANLGLDLAIVKRICNKSSKLVNIYMYEDGLSTYSNIYGDFFDRERFGVYYKSFGEIKGIYLLKPNLLMWKPSFPVITIPEINVNDKDFKGKLNLVFQYMGFEDQYDKKIIFFEESFFADSRNVDDLTIINQIVQMVKEENLFIKLHPRNKINRFENRNIVTNKNTIIPWEVIALNEDLSDKVLITISSAATMVPYIMFGMEYKAILLLDMVSEDEMYGDLMVLYRKICRENSDHFYLPKNNTELKMILQEQINEK